MALCLCLVAGAQTNFRHISFDEAKAAAKADNLFAAAYLVKAGQMYLSAGQNDKALKAFQTVKDKYPQSIEAYDIDKYINRVAE